MDLMRLIQQQQNNTEIYIESLKHKHFKGDTDSFANTLINFLVVGAGGSGAYFVRDFARYLLNSNMAYTIMVVDGDRVEEKNLVRQNFIKSDIGQYKAEVIAKRYSRAYNVPILFKNDYIKNMSDVHKCFSDMSDFATSIYKLSAYPDVINIIVGFTDSVPTRRLLSESILPIHFEKLKGLMSDTKIQAVYEYLKNTFPEDEYNRLVRDGFLVSPVGDYIYIDMGNMDYYGQAVTMFNFTNSNSSFYSKQIYDFVPDFLKDYTIEISCAERAIEIPQTIFANTTSANIAMNILCGILTSDKIVSKIVYFNCLDNSVSGKKYTNDDMHHRNSNVFGFYDELGLYSYSNFRSHKCSFIL